MAAPVAPSYATSHARRAAISPEFFSAPPTDIPNPFRADVPLLDEQYALADEVSRTAIAVSQNAESAYASRVVVSRYLPNGFYPSTRERTTLPRHSAHAFTSHTESPALSMELRFGPRGSHAVHCFPSTLTLTEFQTPAGVQPDHPSYRSHAPKRKRYTITEQDPLHVQCGYDEDGNPLAQSARLAQQHFPTRVYAPRWLAHDLQAATHASGKPETQLRDVAHASGTLVLAELGIAAPHWYVPPEKGARGRFIPHYRSGAVAPWLFAKKREALAQHVTLHQLLSLVNGTAPLSHKDIASVCDELNASRRGRRAA